MVRSEKSDCLLTVTYLRSGVRPVPDEDDLPHGLLCTERLRHPGRPRLFKVVQKLRQVNAQWQRVASQRRFTGKSANAPELAAVEQKECSSRISKSLSTNKLILIAPCAILSSRKNNGGKHGNDKAENMGNNG